VPKDVELTGADINTPPNPKMQDLTICPQCRQWKESLRFMPCCAFKFCDDCVWRSGGCVKCNTRLDFQLLRIYKPLDVMIKECLAPCKYCGELYNTILIKSHENSCPKIPLSDLVKDLTDELPTNVPREKLTEQDMRDFHVKKNLLSSYHKLLPHPTPGGGGFINHVIADTDTLSGIALRYGITVEDLRKANRLVGNGEQVLFQHTVLRIPVASHQPQDKDLDLASVNLLKRRLVARFARKTGCNNLDEAQYYLEAHNYDFDVAFAEFSTDNQVPLPTPPKTISTHVPSPVMISIKSHNRSCCFSLA